jgi:FkbM family methyltransferase
MAVHTFAGRSWQWTDEDRSCWRYLEAHWRDATAALEFVPDDRRALCVQAGGNFGVWPWLLAPHFKQVVTFEPHPTNYGLMRQNLHGTDNIETLPFGLGAQHGSVQLRTSRRNHGAHRLDFNESGEIEVVTLDSLNLPALDLLDLDIEGAEPYALEGAKDTIARFKPVIVVEQWRGWMPRENRESRGHEKELYGNDYNAGMWLRDHGYRLVKRVTQDEIYVPL